MSLRLEMLQVSRLAPRLLGDSADLVRDFTRAQQHENGGFRDREGRPDLYYTVFGLHCFEALQMEIPKTRVASFLDGFGDGEGLDLVHLTCLARAWAALGGAPDSRRASILARLDALGASSNGTSTVTSTFLVAGAAQDLGREPSADEIAAFLETREADDGGYINEPPAVAGSTPATTAAVTLLASLRRPVPRRAARWLEARHLATGGFTAAPGLDIPDLLSTAVVLHALASLERPLGRFVEPCLDFIDTLWTNQGAFHGHWADDEIDCEYTFYGLLALGHLSIWSD